MCSTGEVKVLIYRSHRYSIHMSCTREKSGLKSSAPQIHGLYSAVPKCMADVKWFGGVVFLQHGFHASDPVDFSKK